MSLAISVGQHLSIRLKNVNTGRILEKVTGGEDSGEIDWALSHPTWRLGVRIEGSWPWLGRIDGWWNGKQKQPSKTFH
jgi:hypothetical protein